MADLADEEGSLKTVGRWPAACKCSAAEHKKKHQEQPFNFPENLRTLNKALSINTLTHSRTVHTAIGYVVGAKRASYTV